MKALVCVSNDRHNATLTVYDSGRIEVDMTGYDGALVGMALTPDEGNSVYKALKQVFEKPTAEDVVHTSDEARDWFLTHADGSVKCVGKDGAELVCMTYTAAVRFFEVHGESV